MMRNKEYRRSTYVCSLLTLTMTIIISFIHIGVALISLLFGIAIIITFLYYTSKRYKEIQDLSHYLRRIMDGEYGIEVRNNEEGELSILRNEIFKITARLNEHHDYLNEDRIRMAQALADISHQLKTPLTSIQMMVDLLDVDHLPSNRRAQFMSNIQSQIERMDWLVKVLLKLSKLDAGTVQFLKSETPLEGIVKTAVHSVQVNVNAKHIQLTIQEGESPSIWVDEKWMLESILNVIKNAVDHTPEHGQIEVTWDDNPILTSLTVHNTGNPIEKEDLPYLFKRFYKGKHASDSSVGIGLSLSLQIMESHNGTIDVESSSEKGTSFTFKWYKRK